MRILFSLLVAASLAACGGGDGGGLDCGFAACGGDPVGVWTIADSCLEGTPMIDDCPDAVITSDVSLSGTVTVNADMTESSSITTTGTQTASIPSACLMGATCAQVEAAIDGASCTDAADGCDCTLTIDDTDEASGTWSVSGTTITIVDTGEDPETLDFCVDGDSMQVRTEADGITSGILFTK